MSRRGVGARLFRVEQQAPAFAPLVAALAEAGLRCGWLDLAAEPAPPPALDAAARAGMLRAVSAAEGRTVAVKRLAGPAVIRDLLREHFAGCDLVLVRGEVDAPGLAPSGTGGWRLTATGEDPGGELTSEEVARRLRRPGWPEGR